MPSVRMRRASGKLKSGKVDDDQRVRRLARAHASTSCRERRKRLRDLRDRLGEPGDREAAIVGDQPSAGGGELRAAQARQRDARRRARSSRVSAPA